MARGDDRYQPELHAAAKPPYPKMSEVQEELRKLWEVVAKLEGRLGQVTIRDSLYVMGGIGSTALTPAPAVSGTGTGSFYLDPVSGKYLISESGGAYVELIPSARARVTHSVDSIIADNTITTLGFDTEQFDTDNMHVSSPNSRLTFQTAGVYIVGGLVYWDLPSGPGGVATLESAIMLNGTTYIARDTRYVDDQNGTTNLETIYQFNVGDYVTFDVRQISGATLLVLSAPYSPMFWAVKTSG